MQQLILWTGYENLVDDGALFGHYPDCMNGCLPKKTGCLSEKTAKYFSLFLWHHKLGVGVSNMTTKDKKEECGFEEFQV
jgi:hypothetical protein